MSVSFRDDGFKLGLMIKTWAKLGQVTPGENLTLAKYESASVAAEAEDASLLCPTLVLAAATLNFGGGA